MGPDVRIGNENYIDSAVSGYGTTDAKSRKGSNAEIFNEADIPTSQTENDVRAVWLFGDEEFLSLNITGVGNMWKDLGPVEVLTNWHVRQRVLQEGAPLVEREDVIHLMERGVVVPWRSPVEESFLGNPVAFGPRNLPSCDRIVVTREQGLHEFSHTATTQRQGVVD